MYKQSDIRYFGIKTLYFIVLKNATKKGDSPAIAKEKACAAVELRYGVSPGTIRNIIGKTIRVNSSLLINMFHEQNEQLRELMETEELYDETAKAGNRRK